MNWTDLKMVLETWTGLERDALHVYAGLLGSICAAALLRRTLASILPWLMVLAALMANEVQDIWGDGVAEQWEVAGTKHDVWNTMLAPTILLLMARFAPGIMVSNSSPALEEDQG